MKSYKHLEVITALFAVVLIISNIVSTKITTIGFLTFDAGTILFPLAYIFGDILTEVYGFKRARKVIWIGFGLLALSTITIYIVGLLPSASDWPNQEAYQTILGLTPRIVLGSFAAYLVGEFTNSYILAKIKLKTKGKMLWLRTISSTLIGQILDTSIFVFIAFYGVFSTEVLISIIISNYILKVGIEILFTPFTYSIVNKLKVSEQVDTYDTNTNFNPFKLS
jgi:uncharacterized integral membrane protein (TIGR00697 family)